MKLLNELRVRAGLRTLLSSPDSNPKVAKNQKVGVLTTVLHLAPGNMSGHEVCHKRSAGCTAACLHFSGSPVYYTAKTQARLTKTRLFFSNRDLFMNILALEIHQHVNTAKRKGMAAGVRLNGTSDIVWEKKRFNLDPVVAEAIGATGSTIMELFPNVSFYDYTKIPGRRPPTNYHLTFSESETNGLEVAREMARGFNIASVFMDALPARHLGRRVIDGDVHDYRPSDGPGVVVGLKAKGKLGKADRSGFISRQEDLPLAA